MRGDPPRKNSPVLLRYRSTPHARGSTPSVVLSSPCLGVYPACAGIHRHTKWRRRKKNGLPRMRGDPPFIRADLVDRAMSTPHARGSTHTVMAIYSSSQVYPACAGIHLFDLNWIQNFVSLPRMRGDPPLLGGQRRTALRSTPHARGSTYPRLNLYVMGLVYPACAGIHPSAGHQSIS